jgi:hypothetical protein
LRRIVINRKYYGMMVTEKFEIINDVKRRTRIKEKFPVI